MQFPADGIAVLDNAFDSCDEVIQMAEQADTWNAGKVGHHVNDKARNADVHYIEQQHRLHGELLKTFIAALEQYQSRYDALHLNGGEPLRILRYPVGGHYVYHSDSASSSSKRVISGLLYLNDGYVGGELCFKYQDLVLKPSAGQLVLFPSIFLFLHKSNPIVEGTKYAVVGWFH